MGGSKKKKKRLIIYRQLGERSAEKAAAKVFPNRERYKKYLVKKAVRPT
jgi:hypothetical protein